MNRHTVVRALRLEAAEWIDIERRYLAQHDAAGMAQAIGARSALACLRERLGLREPRVEREYREQLRRG